MRGDRSADSLAARLASLNLDSGYHDQSMPFSARLKISTTQKFDIPVASISNFTAPPSTTRWRNPARISDSARWLTTAPGRRSMSRLKGATFFEFRRSSCAVPRAAYGRRATIRELYLAWPRKREALEPILVLSRSGGSLGVFCVRRQRSASLCPHQGKYHRNHSITPTFLLSRSSLLQIDVEAVQHLRHERVGAISAPISLTRAESVAFKLRRVSLCVLRDILPILKMASRLWPLRSKSGSWGIEND